MQKIAFKNFESSFPFDKEMWFFYRGDGIAVVLNKHNTIIYNPHHILIEVYSTSIYTFIYLHGPICTYVLPYSIYVH